MSVPSWSHELGEGRSLMDLAGNDCREESADENDLAGQRQDEDQTPNDLGQRIKRRPQLDGPWERSHSIKPDLEIPEESHRP